MEHCSSPAKSNSRTGISSKLIFKLLIIAIEIEDHFSNYRVYNQIMAV